MQRIGDYDILNKIAEGGMAEVFLAKSSLSLSIDKYFAIKCLLPKFSSNSKFIELFTNEARVQVNMNHGNVASIFDFGVKGGRFYIAMEHINGINARLLLRSPEVELSEAEIVYLIRESARGLDHAHNCKNLKTGERLNIIHGDISPENIMVTTDGEVKVIDFGVAKKVDVSDGLKAGKKRYMSHAQAQGLPLTARADVYSLSRSFLEYFRDLYGIEEPLSFDDHQQDFEDIKEKLPKELLAILLKGLGYGGESYQEMKQFSKDLTRYLNLTYPDFDKLDLGDKVTKFSGSHFVDIAQSVAAYTSATSVDDRTMLATSPKDRKKLTSRSRRRRFVTKGKKAS
ncbi:MAG: serine/threonine protein kinase [Bdellovibrionales bacterium]